MEGVGRKSKKKTLQPQSGKKLGQEQSTSMMPALKEIHSQGFDGKVEVVSSKGQEWY